MSSDKDAQRDNYNERIRNHVERLPPCYICKKKEFASGHFAIAIAKVEDGYCMLPLGSAHETNLPNGSIVCVTCFGLAVKGFVPDVTMKLALFIKCQVCSEKYPSVVHPNVPSNQGDRCSVFFDKQSRLFRGAWGTRKYDYDRIRINASFPDAMLRELNSTDSICDSCFEPWVDNGWVTIDK